MSASLEGTPECLCVLTRSMCDRQAVPRTSVSGAAVHRPFQAWHSVHTPVVRALPKNLRGSELSSSPVSTASGEESHRRLCLKENQHA